MGKKRIDQLDYAKAAGIFLVILGHCILLDGAADAVSRWIYSFHMPLFFVIAGIGMKLDSKNDVKTLIKNDIKKLIVPYICWSALYIAIFIITDGISTIADNAYKTLTGRGMAPLWFLPALFISKLIFVSMMNLYKKIGLSEQVEWGGITLLIFAVLSIVASKVFPRFENASLITMYPIVTLFRVMPSVFFVAVGWLAGKWLMGKKSNKSTIIITVVFTMCFALVNIFFPNYLNMHTFQFQSMALFMNTGAIGSLGLLNLAFFLPDGIKILSVIGRESLSIMALHYPPIPIIVGVNMLCRLVGIDIPYLFRAIVVITVVLFVLKIFRAVKNRFLGGR